ncbi:MAG: CopD family protein [Gloeobacteraceae cyanobacterium ES-bin-316]|nr:CopD family protein [Ferruginibacter sp.]
MSYFYIKALHIVFIVTWFSGMFYIVRLFIYNTEAGQKEKIEKEILQKQFSIMIRRLWLGITWPSAILTLIFGTWIALISPYVNPVQDWLWAKLAFVAGLYAYHFTLQKIYNNQMKGIFRFTSNQLRIWNEVATILLIAIVMLVSVKDSMSWVWGVVGLALFSVAILSAIKIYKLVRTKK